MPLPKVITFCPCAGSQFASETRFLQPVLLELGHIGFAQHVVIPAMRRQQTSTLLLWQPFGQSRTMTGDGWKPSRFVELDARRLCNSNPLTQNVANIRDMNRALDLYKAAGISVGMYLGSPREEKWNGTPTAAMEATVAATVSPFKDGVDFWVMDELSDSGSASDRLGTAAANVEKYSGKPCLAEPRPIRGRTVRPGGSICTRENWEVHNKERGDREHFGLHELPRDYPLYVIDGNHSLAQARSVLATGARFALGAFTNFTATTLQWTVDTTEETT